jgi:hypothetical protein
MKRIAAIFVLLALVGCTSREALVGSSSAPVESAPERVVWTRDELPVSIRYDRMWEYSASAETSDSAVISDLVNAIKDLQVGELFRQAAEDYTDLLTFRFSDGETLCLEFENQCWVASDQTRYQVRGVERVRSILDRLVEGAE